MRLNKLAAAAVWIEWNESDQADQRWHIMWKKRREFFASAGAAVNDNIEIGIVFMRKNININELIELDEADGMAKKREAPCHS